MLKAGHGFILLTRATPALRDRASFALLAIGKAGLRTLGQSLIREFHPKGIHFVQVIVDGQIASRGCALAFLTRSSLLLPWRQL